MGSQQMRYLHLYAEEIRKGDIIIGDGLSHGDVVLAVESATTGGMLESGMTRISFAAYGGLGPGALKIGSRSHVTVLRPISD